MCMKYRGYPNIETKRWKDACWQKILKALDKGIPYEGTPFPYSNSYDHDHTEEPV